MYFEVLINPEKRGKIFLEQLLYLHNFSCLFKSRIYTAT